MQAIQVVISCFYLFDQAKRFMSGVHGPLRNWMLAITHAVVQLPVCPVLDDARG